MNNLIRENNRILMIHEVGEWIKDFKFLSSDILTFDDGLYSQFKYFDYYPEENLKYFFISTNIINNTDIFNNNYITAPEAHKLYFNNKDLSNYMSLEQIGILKNKDNTIIGGHGHNHLRLRYLIKVKEKINIIRNDIDNMVNIFNNVLNIKLDYFCWPYNFEDMFYKILLKKYNKDIMFFGAERIDINSII